MILAIYARRITHPTMTNTPETTTETLTTMTTETMTTETMRHFSITIWDLRPRRAFWGDEGYDLEFSAEIPGPWIASSPDAAIDTYVRESGLDQVHVRDPDFLDSVWIEPPPYSPREGEEVEVVEVERFTIRATEIEEDDEEIEEDEDEDEDADEDEDEVAALADGIEDEDEIEDEVKP